MSQSEKFYWLYSELKKNMQYNSIPSKHTYDGIVEYLLNKTSTSISIPTKWRYNCSIREFEDKKLLYQGEKKVVFEEELFDIIHNAHVEQTKHAGRDIMSNVLKDFHGVSRTLICLYLKTCDHCIFKRERAGKVIVKPIPAKEYAERYQADLIDMQSKSDGFFSWILLVQDQFTKFVHLRAIAEKEAITIANLLEEIFASFGPPRVLHTNIGSAFENQHVFALCTEWNVELVHKKLRKSSTQGSMEKAKMDIDNIILNWERFFQRNDWANNLKMFQIMKNNKFNKSLQKTPYEAVFGRKPHSLPLWFKAIPNETEDEEQVETKNGFELAQNDQVDHDHLPISHVNLCCTTASSQNEGQDLKHCKCNSGCEGSRCTCKKEGRLCNSKCHKSLSCLNK